MRTLLLWLALTAVFYFWAGADAAAFWMVGSAVGFYYAALMVVLENRRREVEHLKAAQLNDALIANLTRAGPDAPLGPFLEEWRSWGRSDADFTVLVRRVRGDAPPPSPPAMPEGFETETRPFG